MKDGGPAFPHDAQFNISGNPLTDDDLDALDSLMSRNRGMSLRDWFAGQALAGLVQSVHFQGIGSDDPVNECATVAYAIADAMLKAREAT